MRRNIPTIKDTLSAIRALGLTANWTQFAEYRINFVGGDEATAYYTNDAEDAVKTAEHMAAWDLTRKSLHRDCGTDFKERQ